MTMTADPTVVLVDDSPDDRLMAARLLRQEISQVEIVEVDGPRSWQDALEGGTFDVVVTDCVLNWTDGLTILRAVKERWPDRPVIMLTATGSEEIAVEAMKAGLDDYLLKRAERPLRLARVIHALLERADERRADHALRIELTRQREERAIIADSLGRLVPGDSPHEVAAAVCEEVEKTLGLDVIRVLRFGTGPRVEAMVERSPIHMQTVGEKRSRYLRERASRGPWIEDWRLPVSDDPYMRAWVEAGLKVAAYVPVTAGMGECLLIGGSTGTTSTEDMARLLPALIDYGAVLGALMRPHFEREQAIHDRAAVIRDIIERKAFLTVFQPIVDLGSRAVVAWEALSRFTDGVLPNARLSEANAVGLGNELELALIERAFESVDPLDVSAALAVNVSARVVMGERLADLVGRGGPLTVLEITEHEPIDDYARLRQAIEQLGDQVRLSVDDAGAGFASLRHILELRPHFVKLDGDLVRGIDHDPARQAMVAGMVHFAGETDCTLIAEGVETEGQRRTLRRIGVGVGQGYLFGRPVPAEELSRRRRVALSSRAPGSRGHRGSTGTSPTGDASVGPGDPPGRDSDHG